MLMQILGSKLAIAAFVLSMLVITITHTSELNFGGITHFDTLVREETNCTTDADTKTNTCTEVTAQIRALAAAMAAAVLTIATVIVTSKPQILFYGIWAGITALKAVFHQTMSMTNGEITLPLVILGVAIFITIPVAVGLFKNPPNGEASQSDTPETTTEQKMEFWDNFTSNPPNAVLFNTDSDPSQTHIALYSARGDRDEDILWTFGEGTKWHTLSPPWTADPPRPDETLCGLKLSRGERGYAISWLAFDNTLTSVEDGPTLHQLHTITCMTCRQKVMYGICRIIQHLYTIREAIGEEYVQRPPILHAAHIEDDGAYRATTSNCRAARKEFHPHFVNFLEKEKITCPECIANYASTFPTE